MFFPRPRCPKPAIRAHISPAYRYYSMDALDRAQQFDAQAHQHETVSAWHRVPVARRALVLVLLFHGHDGELRVVLTKRLSRLRSFPGHISLPGGKADTGLELPWMVARRETSEEIGIGINDAELWEKHRLSIDRVTELPCYLSRTFSAVRPCVAFMNTTGDDGLMDLGTATNDNDARLASLKLRLNPGESSSIFLVPLRDFLYPSGKREVPVIEALERTYRRVRWGGLPWNLRSYTFPQNKASEALWLSGYGDLSASESEGEADSEIGSSTDAASEPTSNTEPVPRKRAKKDLSGWGNLGSRRHAVTNEKIYDVWGLTANILHDLAEVVYLEPHEHIPGHQYGEEELIWSVWHHGGQMRLKERSETEARLISAGASDAASFGDVLPRTEFLRLKRLYAL